MCHLCLHGRKCWLAAQDELGHRLSCNGKNVNLFADLFEFRFGFISIFDCISFGLSLVMKLKLIMICTSSALASKQGRDNERERERGREEEKEGNPISWLNKSTWEPSSLPAGIVFIVAEIVA